MYMSRTHKKDHQTCSQMACLHLHTLYLELMELTVYDTKQVTLVTKVQIETTSYAREINNESHKGGSHTIDLQLVYVNIIKVVFSLYQSTVVTIDIVYILYS